MRLVILITCVLGVALAAPTPTYASRNVKAVTLARPPPCQPSSPAPSEEETKARFDKFADAIIVKKNITEAFLYISDSYIVRKLACRTPSY